MKKSNTTIGKTYAVTSQNGCTVTTEDGLTLVEIEAGKQGYFVAVSGKVQLSDDSAVLTQVFKLAPQQRLALLGVLGGNAGGNGGLPPGYKRVAYLEDTGTQYIDTGIIISYPFSFEATTSEINTDTTQSYNSISGFSETSGEKRSAFVFAYAPGWAGVSGTVGIWADYSVPNFKYKEKNVIRFEAGEPVTLPRIYVNGILSTNISYAKPPYKEELDIITQPIYLFCINSNGVANLTSYRGNIRIYEIKILCNKEYHLIPCLHPTGAPCMYDTVNKKPFYNQGAGDFLYPTESTTYALRRVLPDWGKLTPHGLRRLYHVPANYKGELYDYALEHGYKHIVEPEKPEVGYWSPRWTETEDEIVLEWVETEPPVDEFGPPDENLTETE